ncbi:eukaryotic peptide chain release factor subunit 1-like [Panulirus ornatus]|uniref:eukaryotic peptide chain release factor subunit 1-like n=1 Tax=Panulirus ornatus TaxID=150431 RepID=UPI003A85827D
MSSFKPTDWEVRGQRVTDVHVDEGAAGGSVMDNPQTVGGLSMRSRSADYWEEDTTTVLRNFKKQKSVALWALRKVLDDLDQLVVRPFSVVSLILPPTANLTVARSRMKEEYSKAANIKSAVNRISVQESLHALRKYLQDMKSLPENGVALYFGSAVKNPITGESFKLRKEIEPHLPIKDFVYSSESSCVTAPLWKLVNAQDTEVGYIILDGSQVLIAVASDNMPEIKYRESVLLPRKHGRGGQSAARFARLRLESRHLYLKKVAELSSVFLMSDNKAQVSALVLAGSGYLKDELIGLLHPCLQKVLRKVVTVSYGGGTGLNEAMTATRDLLKDLRLERHRTLFQEFFENLKTCNVDLVSYGQVNVSRAVEAGAARLVLVCEDSPFVPWLSRNCMEFHTDIEIFRNVSSESNMVIKGFDGVCAFHRFPFASVSDDEDGQEEVDVVYE